MPQPISFRVRFSEYKTEDNQLLQLLCSL